MMRWLCLVVMGAIVTGAGNSAWADQIDLSLNVIYDNPNEAATSSGTWQLVGKSDGFGIAGIGVTLSGVSGSTLAAPRGTVNGGAPAGFSAFAAFPSVGGATELTIGQIPLTPSQVNGGEQTVFYGVGTLSNGAPGDIGPAFTSLEGTAGTPWATGDVFGDANWDLAAILATGSFAPGATLDFVESGGRVGFGSVWTTLGTSGLAGTLSCAVHSAATGGESCDEPSDETTLTAIVRDNIFLGDYNGDGLVSLADYTVWRDTLGSAVPAGSAADGDGDGVITANDYDIWKAQFALPAAAAGSASAFSGGLAAGSASVPEPGSITLAGAAVVLLLFRGKRGKN